MIEGVATKKLRVIPDERGRLMECLRSDDELFIKFGQMYMTTTLPGRRQGLAPAPRRSGTTSSASRG